MSANSFGQHFRVTTFGESHGVGLGAVIDGCPAGVRFNQERFEWWLKRRRPGHALTSQRQESDVPQILSGIFEGKTLGTPIAALVLNQDARSQDYEQIKQEPRRGHADDLWKLKFSHSDHRGGGRASGRETLARVMAGSVAEMFLKEVLPELKVVAFVSQIGPIQLKTEDRSVVDKLIAEKVDLYQARFPGSQGAEVEALLKQAQAEGQSYGGKVELHIKALPVGLGQPVFHKFKSDLASALMGIGATNSIEFGLGFHAGEISGTEFHQSTPDVYGGIRGGITTGEPLALSLGFKPTSSILDTAKRGRHDPAIMIRAVPVVESMAFLVIADHMLWQRLDRA